MFAITSICHFLLNRHPPSPDPPNSVCFLPMLIYRRRPNHDLALAGCASYMPLQSRGLLSSAQSPLKKKIAV
jgi:hypothetical protein